MNKDLISCFKTNIQYNLYELRSSVQIVYLANLAHIHLIPSHHLHLENSTEELSTIQENNSFLNIIRKTRDHTKRMIFYSYQKINHSRTYHLEVMPVWCYFQQ